MQSPARPFTNQQEQPMYQQNMEQPMGGKKKMSFKRLMNMKTMVVLIVILQIIMIVLLLNPSTLIQQYQNQQIINTVASKTTVNTGETPVVATVTNADQLRSQNAAQAQVYKDAQNGDYVLGYTNKMVIYRKATDTIVYDGDNPNDLVTKAQTKIVTDITDKAKAAGLVTNDSTETPQVSIITDVKSLQTSNPTFYASARNNDIVALFPEAQVILIYNQDTSTIVNSGKYATNITAL